MSSFVREILTSLFAIGLYEADWQGIKINSKQTNSWVQASEVKKWQTTYS